MNSIWGYLKEVQVILCSLLRSDRQTQCSKGGVCDKIESAQQSGQLASFFCSFSEDYLLSLAMWKQTRLLSCILSSLDLQHEFYSIAGLERVM